MQKLGTGIRLFLSKITRDTTRFNVTSDGRISINNTHSFTTNALRKDLEFNLLD